MIHPSLPVFVGLLVAGLAGPALADPCKAIPDNGPAPSWLKAGATVRGSVPHVGDGDSLCIARGPDPQDWVEVRLADYFAPELSEPGGVEARDTLARLTRGRTVVCAATAGRNGRVISYDRMIAVCRLDGVSLGDRLRQAGATEGGRGR